MAPEINPYRLSDQQALVALEWVGRTVVSATGVGPSVALRELRATDLPTDASEFQAVVEKTNSDPDALKRAGAIAKFALSEGLQSEDDILRQAVEAAIADVLSPTVTKDFGITLLIGVGALLGLAALSKLSYKNSKWTVAPGLPDINGAGEAIGKLIKSALGRA